MKTGTTMYQTGIRGGVSAAENFGHKILNFDRK